MNINDYAENSEEFYWELWMAKLRKANYYPENGEWVFRSMKNHSDENDELRFFYSD